MAITPRSRIDAREIPSAIMELQTVGSATAGTMAANKALIPTTGGVVDTLDITTPKFNGTAIAATAAEINRAADVSTRVVAVTTTPLAIVEATHEGKTVTLAKSDNLAVTLPAATGGGARYRFIITLTAASGSAYSFAVTGNDLMTGVMVGGDSTDGTAHVWATAANTNRVTLGGTTNATGGTTGTLVEFEDVAADLWYVRIVGDQADTEATPFSNV